MLRSILILLISFVLASCLPPAQQQVQLNDSLPTPAVEVAAPTVAAVPAEPVTVASVSQTDPEELVYQAEDQLSDDQPVAELVEPQLLPYNGDFPLSEHSRVEKLLNHYTGKGRNTFGTWLERAGRYIPDIQLIFAEEGVPLDLAYLAMIESGFNLNAYSWAHAAGPWQFIEGTGNMYGLTNDWWRDERLDLERSTRAAASHLKYLHARFDGDWYLAVAAYNAGGGKVRKAIKASDSRDFWVLTEGDVLREETRDYLPKLIAALKVIKDLEGYGFADLEFDEPLDYETVTVATATDLEIVARLCEVSYDELKTLNPNLKRWSTPPKLRDYPVKVPLGSADQFYSRYTELPVKDRANYHRHQVKAGDSLLALAKKYRIQVEDIVSLNNIKNPLTIQIGADLILPLKKGYTSLPVAALNDQYARSRRKTYRVRNGDSLWSIANRFDVTEKQLRVWNKLGWSNLIKPGQSLVVSERGRRNLAKAAPAPVPSRKLVYKVLPGDTLWGIGRQFDVDTEMIRTWNDLSGNHVLLPGQTLTLMVPVSRQG
ncbi:MAG TPA: LysM peptidoglycan-binding domain-containing protein [Malonomonas sp.]